MNKAELRGLYLSKRRSLTDQEYDSLNLRLVNNFFSTIQLIDVKLLHLFLPIARNKEPDTYAIAERVRSEFPGIRISIPKVGLSGTLEHYIWSGKESLALSAWGIPEAATGETTPVDAIDMVLVPLVIFDQQGHRVGYGKGYYDRFLSACRHDCKKIGLSLFPPVESIDDLTPHDQHLDFVVTPDRSYKFD